MSKLNIKVVMIRYVPYVINLLEPLDPELGSCSNRGFGIRIKMHEDPDSHPFFGENSSNSKANYSYATDLLTLVIN